MSKSYYITSPHYIRQAGQAEPQYVHASAENPAKVTLDDDQEPGFSQAVDKDGKPFGPKRIDGHWHPADKAPAAPKPAHAESKGGPPKGHQAFSGKSEKS